MVMELMHGYSVNLLISSLGNACASFKAATVKVIDGTGFKASLKNKYLLIIPARVDSFKSL